MVVPRTEGGLGLIRGSTVGAVARIGDLGTPDSRVTKGCEPDHLLHFLPAGLVHAVRGAALLN